jgi:hypothetical protein
MDSEIFLFFSLLGNATPYLVLLSGLWRMMFLKEAVPFLSSFSDQSQVLFKYSEYISL